MSTRKCIIIHGCPSNPEVDGARTYDKHWISWTKHELLTHGFLIETPLMPRPWAPIYKEFKEEFDKLVIDQDTILIGHSCGCAFLVRWLGETKQKIHKLILVTPWKIPDPNKLELEAFYRYQVDESVQNRVGEIVMFTSNNEEADGKKSLEIFHQALGGVIINLKDRGHYTLDDMGTEEFPELISTILK